MWATHLFVIIQVIYVACSGQTDDGCCLDGKDVRVVVVVCDPLRALWLEKARELRKQRRTTKLARRVTNTRHKAHNITMHLRAVQRVQYSVLSTVLTVAVAHIFSRHGMDMVISCKTVYSVLH
mgnify:CR=1 FL=1